MRLDYLKSKDIAQLQSKCVNHFRSNDNQVPALAEYNDNNDQNDFANEKHVDKFAKPAEGQ